MPTLINNILSLLRGFSAQMNLKRFFYFIINMKQLEKEFIGKGQVKGFLFTQLKNNEKAYIYKVEDGLNLRYEVFKHKENLRFGCVSYPKSNSFGIWAFTTPCYNRALEIFEDLSINKEFENLSNTF